MEPPDLDGARIWYGRAAEAGSTDAMLNLGHLLAKQVEPPDLNEALRWWRTAAKLGNSDAVFNIGLSCVEESDDTDAVASWAALWADGSSPEASAAAAESIASVHAALGQVGVAVRSLRIARDRGSIHASVYAAVFDPSRAIRKAACVQLTKVALDALNYLGVAAMNDRRSEDARRYWATSKERGNVVGSILWQIAHF